MKYLTKNKNWKIDKDYDIDKILYLLIDSPTCINNCNDFYWLNNEKLVHREYDLPAYIINNGYISWWKYNKRYRKNNNPHIIQYDGFKKIINL